jgi:O-antigen/teichoic acid export membrane protein
MASQSIIITRLLGLKATAAWSVGTKTFNLISQAIWRISDMSGSAFAEMMVRGEIARLRERYRAVVILTASLGGFAAVSFALCNSLFIPLWLNSEIAWPLTNDMLLGIWMIVLAVLHCHSGFVLLTKKVGFMRCVYFVEGIVFVTLALLVAHWGGLPAIITCSIVCSTCFSGAYGVWRISHYFKLSLREVAWGWLGPMMKVLLFYLPVAILTWWGLLLLLLPAITRLGVNVMVAGSVGFYLFLRYGITRAFQTELLARTPKSVSPILKRIFAHSYQ